MLPRSFTKKTYSCHHSVRLLQGTLVLGLHGVIPLPFFWGGDFEILASILNEGEADKNSNYMGELRFRGGTES